MRRRAVTAGVGLSACAAWVVLPCLADGHALFVVLGVAAPSLLVCLFALVRSRPWVNFLAFPAALAGAHFFVGPQSPTTIIAQLATLAAWVALIGRAPEEDAAATAARPVEWRATTERGSVAGRPTHAAVAATLIVAPSLGAWALSDVEALAAASFGALGPLALVGGSLLATCVGLAFAADLLEGRAPRGRNITRLRRLATATVCALGAWAAVVIASAWG